MDPWIVITGLSAMAALMGALRQRRAQLWVEQSRQAREHGLVVTELGRWSGRRDGVYVVVQVDVEPNDPWSVRAKLPFPTPRGFRLGTKKAGRDGERLMVPIQPIVDRLQARGWRVELGASVILRRPRQFSPFTSAQRQVELADGIQSVVTMVRQLQRRYRELIETGLERVLPAVPRPVPTPGRPGELRGMVDGVGLSLVGPRLKDDHWTLSIRAELPVPLPISTRVKARQGPGGPLGDLVLDQALSASSSDLGELGRRLARDAVRGPVLDVLAAHPASELRTGEVIHVVTDGALDVSAALDRVTELVEVLTPRRSPTQPDHATA
ncbi:MAG: hypothetical protein AAGA48_05175 [Myxococcota bacterium]